MRSRTGLALLLAISLAAAACGSDGNTDPVANGDGPASGGTLNVHRLESFDGWVLDSAAAYGTYQTHPAVLEPLVRFAADGVSVEPGLAETWEYDDEAYAWTFTLRDNAAFSNGDLVTADDVVFSFGIWSNGVNFGGSFAEITGVEAVDEHSVRFTLAAPDDTVPALLSGSIAGVMPKDFAGMTEDEYYANPIGAGAYKVDEWSAGGPIVLSRNEHYYSSDRPYFDEVVVKVVPDANELAILFEAGDADIVEYVSPATAGQFPDDSITVTPPSQVNHLSLNVGSAPLDDVDVRRAIASALDYDAIVKGPFEGYATEPTGMLAPNLANWAPPSSPYYSTDVDAARELLAGSSGAGGFTAELIYDSGNATDALIAQIIQSNLAEIGVEVELTGLETLAFLDRAFTLDADMMVWSYGAISPDISDPLGWVAGTGYLFTGDDDANLQTQRSAYLTTIDPATKEAAVVAIQDEALDHAAAIAVAESPTLHAVGSDIQGFDPAPWGLYYWDTVSRG